MESKRDDRARLDDLEAHADPKAGMKVTNQQAAMQAIQNLPSRQAAQKFDHILETFHQDEVLGL